MYTLQIKNPITNIIPNKQYIKIFILKPIWSTSKRNWLLSFHESQNSMLCHRHYQSSNCHHTLLKSCTARSAILEKSTQRQNCTVRMPIGRKMERIGWRGIPKHLGCQLLWRWISSMRIYSRWWLVRVTWNKFNNRLITLQLLDYPES